MKDFEEGFDLVKNALFKMEEVYTKAVYKAVKEMDAGETLRARETLIRGISDASEVYTKILECK